MIKRKKINSVCQTLEPNSRKAFFFQFFFLQETAHILLVRCYISWLWSLVNNVNFDCNYLYTVWNPWYESRNLENALNRLFIYSNPVWKGLLFVSCLLIVSKWGKKRKSLVCKTARLPLRQLGLNSLLAPVQVNAIIILPAFPLLLSNSIIGHL